MCVFVSLSRPWIKVEVQETAVYDNILCAFTTFRERISLICITALVNLGSCKRIITQAILNRGCAIVDRDDIFKF